MEYSQRVVEAFSLMYELHRKQARKGSRVPYITHLIGAASIVGAYGGDENQFIAALLHDAVEDQGGIETLDRIRTRFGDDVADLVNACSDAYGEPKPRWKDRKKRFLESLKNADARVKLIVAADKLYNVREVTSQLRARGPRVWRIFKAGRDSSLWLQAATVKALGHNGWRHPVYDELAEAVEKLHHLAEIAGRENPEKP